jgi:hypothetical protein
MMLFDLAEKCYNETLRAPKNAKKFVFYSMADPVEPTSEFGATPASGTLRLTLTTAQIQALIAETPGMPEAVVAHIIASAAN